MMKLANVNVGLIEEAFETFKNDAENWDAYDFDMMCLHYEELLETVTENSDDYLMVVKNDQYFDIVIKRNVGNISVLEPCFDTEVSAEEIRLLFSEYENAVVGVNSYCSIDIEEEGWFKCSLKSNIDNDFSYIINGSMFLIVSKEENIYLLRDYFENTYLGDININKVSFKLFSLKELQEMFLHDGFFSCLWAKPYGHYSNVGFHYFNVNEFCSNVEDIYYLVALDNSENIVGVIKYGTYENGKRHLGLNYIDVRKDLRGRGLATKLIKEFARVIPKNLPLILSNESEMGEICHMGKHFKEEIAKIAPSMKVVFTSELYSYSEL